MTASSSRLRALPVIIAYGYLFFLAIALIGGGMKHSFAEPLQAFLELHAGEFTELRSFVIGVIGTAFVQSSSTVTSMCVTLTQAGIMPIVIAAGIVHGANLGTSVTSSIVAFATDAPRFTGRIHRDLWALFFEPRGAGFERAVGAAVVHDFFNIIMITAILLFLELPFGWILELSDASATWLETRIGRSDGLLDALAVVSPATYTKPVVTQLLHVGVPGWMLAAAGLPLLFGALKGFSASMKNAVMAGVDGQDAQAIGRALLGRNAYDTFLRGMVLTLLVQSSSATTSMVVPLAAMGFFDVRTIFPFILGANVGTTGTAMLAATSALGEPGFHDGMTIALCHLYLNAFAVFTAWVVVGLPTSILGSADFLAHHAARVPAVLLVYLAGLCVGVPLLVYLAPQNVAGAVLTLVMLFMLVGPHVYLRSKLQRELDRTRKRWMGSVDEG